ncbi:hypothetical protein [Campylobacter corcagiensis]|uniref:DUF1018 domain-containing protein n=1 Tax=Campylobacter corcagiensis TaxID=1448857 RepID=A0A7M1LF85_9BACT|nr:hypothetical protein [Campylobacter corcagiensis]QKF64575.1 hypothetical protein CCORG_0714 [Campylobacter corcagiensis]QOQ87252.1 hypothetical protein IMC76_08600 [Campylobacter corcagiensis]
MTKKQRLLRNSLLARIHLHPFYKSAFEVGAWSEFLENSFKTNSSANLSIKELILLLDIMNGKDAIIDEIDYKGRARLNPNLATQKQITKCLSLKDELNYSDAKFREFVFKNTKKMLWKLEMINSFTKGELSKLISIMSKIKAWRDKR